jgi:penicillin-binding protein 1C
MRDWRQRWILGARVAAGFVGLLTIADLIAPPDMTRARTLSPEVTARDGTLLRAFLSKDGAWRIRTTADQVGPRYLAMLKAYEDKRFERHWGVDPPAMLRASLQFAHAGRIVSGGSTLTMQVARLLEPHGHGVWGKTVQMVRAVQLEERYSKDEILSLYLTLAPMGGNLEGVRAASLSYFRAGLGGKRAAGGAAAIACEAASRPSCPARAGGSRQSLAAHGERSGDHIR